jgi:hypothetical protein
VHADRQGGRRESWPAVRVLGCEVRQQHRNPGGVGLQARALAQLHLQLGNRPGVPPDPGQHARRLRPDISTRAHPDRAISSTANMKSRCTSSPTPAGVSCSVTAAMMRGPPFIVPHVASSPATPPVSGDFSSPYPSKLDWRTVQRPRTGATAAMMEPPAGHTRALGHEPQAKEDAKTSRKAFQRGGHGLRPSAGRTRTQSPQPSRLRT